MSTKGKRLIYVGSADGSAAKPLNVEGKAIAAIAPGTIVEEVAAGLQVNAAAATLFGQELLVADKDQLRTKSVDDAWTINENMVAIKARSGEYLNVFVAAGNNLTARGMPLSLDGSGMLQIATTPATVGVTSEQVLAYSDEIVNVAADALTRVRIA